MSMWSVSFVMSLCVCTGCAAAYIPPPLTTQHPAHPEATATPALPPSSTLAYGPSDIPTPQPASSMAQHEMTQGMQQGTQGAHASAQTSPPAGVGEGMAQHGGHDAQPSTQQSQPSVVGEGKVIAVTPGKSQIVVDHKAIPNVMGAMTMGYQVEPPSLLAGVKAGDTIRFTMDPQRQIIVKIEKLHE